MCCFKLIRRIKRRKKRNRAFVGQRERTHIMGIFKVIKGRVMLYKESVWSLELLLLFLLMGIYSSFNKAARKICL
jgi:hypothetical protein